MSQRIFEFIQPCRTFVAPVLLRVLLLSLLLSMTMGVSSLSARMLLARILLICGVALLLSGVLLGKFAAVSCRSERFGCVATLSELAR